MHANGTLSFLLNGKEIECERGLTVAGAIFKKQLISARTTSRNGKPRLLFCGMGVCFDCAMTINGVPNTRACVTTVQEGMVVKTQIGASELGRSR